MGNLSALKILDVKLGKRSKGWKAILLSAKKNRLVHFVQKVGA